jgi:hypothetical protein
MTGKDSFQEISYTPGQSWGPYEFTFKGRTAHSEQSDTTYTLAADDESIHVDSKTPCQTADLRREKETPTPSAANADSPLVVIVNASSAAAGASAKFDSRPSDSDAANAQLLKSVQKEQLKQVIIALVNISHSQAPLPALLRQYVRDYPGTTLWGQITRVVPGNAPIVDSLVGTLKQFDVIWFISTLISTRSCRT